MKSTKLTLILMAAFAAVAIYSCKKDNSSETTYNYLNGGMGINLDSYVDGLDSIRVTAYGVSHPDGDDLYYYYKVTDGENRASDTVKVASKIAKTSFNRRFKLPYEGGTYTVTCGAFASGYYSTSSTAEVTLVKPGIGESLTGTGIEYDMPHITSGGFNYYYTTIGQLDWMMNNLADKTRGKALENCDVTSYPFGRYYTFNEASEACPSGWRLPTVEEWKGLSEKAGALMVDARFNGKIMWPVSEVDKNNSTGISAIPAGYATLVGTDARFKGLGEYAIFWSGDSEGDEAYYIYMIGTSENIYTALGDKTAFSASVRCVR